MREVLKVFRHSDHNEIALYWITNEYVDPHEAARRGFGYPVYDGSVLALFTEEDRSPTVRDMPWRGAFRSERSALAELSPLTEDPEYRYSVVIEPHRFRVLAAHSALETAVWPEMHEMVVLERMVPRLRELLSSRRIALAVTGALRHQPSWREGSQEIPIDR